MSQFFTSGGQSIAVSASVVSPSNEYSGLISFRIGWFDLLAVQGTLSRVFSNSTVQKHQKHFLSENLPIPVSSMMTSIDSTANSIEFISHNK